MNTELNADEFELNDIYTRVLRNVLQCFIGNYHSMISDKESFNYPATSLEDLIRNIFIKKYVRKNKMKYGLDTIRFEVETGTINESFHNEGYIDIQVINIYNYGDEDEYFAFECKRLKNNEKNKDYIDKGILRFVNNKYAEKMFFSGMIGFVKDSVITIDTIAEDIKKRITNIDSTILTLNKVNIAKNFEYCYHSKHQRINNSPIELYHLLLDFQNITFNLNTL